MAIVHFEQKAGASDRVIGPDGLERNVLGIADWVTAIRSGAIDDRSLFFDVQAQRWRPVPSLEIYIQAKEVVASGASGSVESGSSRTTRGRYAVLLAALVLLGLAAWAAGGQVDVQSLVQRIPAPALFGGAGLAVVLLAEEFYWLALRLTGTGLGGIGPGARFGVQVLSLSTTALAVYAGMAISNGNPDTPISFLVRNAALIAVGYAVVIFLWSVPLARLSSAPPAKKALASVLASAMLFGTLYMALAPSARHSAATDLSPPQRPSVTPELPPRQ